MSMNPISTTKNIKNDYLSYLESMMMVRNPEINKKTREAIRKNTFVKGPYIESTPPFVTGSSLQNLVESGIASKEFNKISTSMNIERPLYIHQESSFKKIVCDKKNIIVSTGTGSGKTECYLYPIFDYLMKEKEKGTLGSGVRALLLFPMNALANDQMKRIRELLREYPPITFGRYTGETLEKQKDAKDQYIEKFKNEPISNEVLSREEMRLNPPNILLTNYAMLEYLLLRPNDSELFDGNNGKTWRFIVLDEAHTYKGATGTEIAFLLRRLKDRICNNRKGELHCIATSATLGDINKLDELALFASTIFDEQFSKEDIILSKRINRTVINEECKFSPLEYEKILNEVKEIHDVNERGKVVYDILKNDCRIIEIQEVLKDKPKVLSEVAQVVFPEIYLNVDKESALTALIKLGALAKQNQDSAALLPARYHLFVKALEGMYVMFYPNIQVFLDRKETWPYNGRNIPVFELANCQHCGQEYIVGNNIDGYLRQPKEAEKPEYYMVASQYKNDGSIDIDEDDEAFEVINTEKTDEYILCTTCGKLTPANQKFKDNCCDVNDRKKFIHVYKIVAKGDANTCAMCGSLSPSIIKRFMTSNQAATFVLANSIYSMIPPNVVHIDSESVSVDDFIIDDDSFTDDEIIIKNDFINESGRKLLIFSDNRQEAAYFAGYMNNKYNQNLWRKLILKELKHNNGLMLDDLINRLVKSADEMGLYNDDEDAKISSDRKMIIASQYVFSEFMGFEKSSGLEGRGYVAFYPEPLRVKDNLNLNGEHYWNLLRYMMDTLRFSNATNYPENLNAEDEFFEPRNRYVYFREEGRGNLGSKQILGFIPHEKRNNKRISVINKLLLKQGNAENELNFKSRMFLKTIYGQFVKLVDRGYFSRHQMQIEGTCLTINYKKWKVRYIKDDEILYKCNRCGKISSYAIDGFCAEMKCNGSMEKISAKEYRYDPY
ncbi:MAG: DEAD/DEAH box helicase, partial [Sedimentibacter sp.]